jgi:predicted dehydrogenase
MKILVTGLGSIGQRHVRNLRALLGAEAEIAAFRVRRRRDVITPELTIEPGADVETHLGVRTHLTLDDALAERPEIVFVTNPNSLHMPVALAAARMGCHLFIEKPLSHSLEGVGELVDLVDTKRLVALVGYQFRFHPAFQIVRAQLEQNAIGAVLAARLEFGEYLPGWHRYEDYREMHASRRDQGGGVILSQIHDLDIVYALFGLPRRVVAMGGHLSGLDVDVEDTASLLMECTVQGRRIPVHLHQDYVQRPPARSCEVIGDAGKIVLDWLEPSVRLYAADGRVAEHVVFEGFQRNDLFLAELRHFLACVRGEATPAVSLRDGSQSLRMALAARESLTTGLVVELA